MTDNEQAPQPSRRRLLAWVTASGAAAMTLAPAPAQAEPPDDVIDGGTP